MSEERLEPFYADAERGSLPCRIRGCVERRVRGITVCPRHEQAYDHGEWAQGGMDGWRAFLDAMGGDEEVVMAGDGGRVPDVSEQRAEGHEAGIEAAARALQGPPMLQQSGIFPENRTKAEAAIVAYLSHADPASVLATLLAESPDATVAAIEALLTRETPLRAAAHVMYEAPPEADVARVWDVALSAACRSLLSKAPKEDGDA